MLQYLNYGVAGILLVLSGLFSGLTLGLMSLDNVGLQIIIDGGNPEEARLASLIKPVREKGNLLLCTLLLGNTVVNSSLSILMAGFLSGPIALFASTMLIVIFGEICPQALCSRHGLRIGAASLPIVRAFMYILMPLAYPISLLLDRVLGREVGTVYTRDQLRALVAIHVENPDASQASGLTTGDQQIMQGVLNYKDKKVEEVYTKIGEVFTLYSDDNLDFQTMLSIYKSGFTRIPVLDKSTGEVSGILYTKDLILVDPDDEIEVSTILSFHGHRVEWVGDSTPLDKVFAHFNACGQHLLCVFPSSPPELHETNGKVDYEGEFAVTDGASPFGDAKMMQKKRSERHERHEQERELMGVISMEDVLEEVLQQEIVDETDNYEDMRNRAKRVNKDRRQGVQKFLELFEDKFREDVSLTSQEIAAICSYLPSNVKEFAELEKSKATLRRLVELAQVVDDEMDSEMAGDDEGNTTVDDVEVSVNDDNGGPHDVGEETEDDDDGSRMNNTPRPRRRILYKYGMPTTKFTLILQGRVELKVGGDGFEAEAGPWNVLAPRALDPYSDEDGKGYIPDFTAVVSSPYRLVQIDRVDFLAALGGSSKGAFSDRLGGRVLAHRQSRRLHSVSMDAATRPQRTYTD